MDLVFTIFRFFTNWVIDDYSNPGQQNGSANSNIIIGDLDGM